MGYIVIPMGNHDNARINVKRTPKELEMIYAFGLTMPGIPFIFYGNEIGMKQLYNLPFVEGAYQPRAGNRTPMQWAPGKNLGFSIAAPEMLYQSVDPSPDAPNIATEETDPNSLLNKTRKLIALKKTEPALSNCAEFVPVYAKENAYPFIYARAEEQEVILVILNPADRLEKAEFKLNIKSKGMKLLAGDKLKFDNIGQIYSVEVPAISYAIYKLKN
jgi:maltose alpha-D-glucosyltransferase/alpha-amylase